VMSLVLITKTKKKKNAIESPLGGSSEWSEEQAID
jgi:hypothetical protein